ncbi:ead/Ea22-like family protein [Salmonella enterica]|nr:ead/Ea22-like family protein [Salmonella enterica]EKS4583041.1 ead/Ea22-like family protein [Salmonella enterica]EKS4605296.1 ead/Ea22-like family protein [Salmonella enterica]
MKDKQALRQIAESVDREEWDVLDNGDADYQVIVSGSLERGTTYRSYQPVANGISEQKIAAFIAAFNPKVALALLDELEATAHSAAVDHEAACSLVEENEELKRRITEMESKNSNLRTIAHEQNELAIRVNLDSINDAVEMDRLHKRIAETDQRNAELTARIEPMDRRIAELERSETQLINERDNAESALNDAYKAVMGQAPEWSNWFSFENAIDEIELACELWRNQTDDVIQFRQRIAELEAREVILPDRKSEIFWPGDAAEFDILGYVIAVKSAIRAAGIKVKG